MFKAEVLFGTGVKGISEVPFNFTLNFGNYEQGKVKLWHINFRQVLFLKKILCSSKYLMKKKIDLQIFSAG